MKVSNNGIGQALNNIEKAKSNKADSLLNPQRRSSANSGESVKDSAKLNLSGRAHALNQAKEIAGDQSIDEAKVARLQKMIDDGNYKVDAQAVADRLVNEHLAFPTDTD